MCHSLGSTFREHLLCMEFFARTFPTDYLSNFYICSVRHCYSTHFTAEPTQIPWSWGRCRKQMTPSHTASQ